MCLKHTVVKKLGRKKRTRHMLSRSPLTGKRVSSFLLFPHSPYLSQVPLCVLTKNRTFLWVTVLLVFLQQTTKEMNVTDVQLKHV